MQISDEQIEAGAKVFAKWILHDWDGLGNRDISADYPDWHFSKYGGLNFQGGQPAARKFIRRIIEEMSAISRPAEEEPVDKPEMAFRDWAVLLEFGYMKRYIDNLHACISRHPHSSVTAKNADAYISYCSEIEQSANSIRDTYEKLLAVAASPPAPQAVWQPMDTAPKEIRGSFAVPCLIGSVSWGKEGRVHHHVGPIVWQGEPYGWEFTELDYDVFPPPTHWQPWPEAATNPEAGRGNLPNFGCGTQRQGCA